MKKVLITGSAGLVGSEAVNFFIPKGFLAIGIDNNMRENFFGKEASTKRIISMLEKKHKNAYVHYNSDIRDSKKIEGIFKKFSPIDLVIHTAARPNHNWNTEDIYEGFEINTGGTVKLLDYCRKYSPRTVFIFVSSNKVYGEFPNSLPLIELKTRFDLENNNKYFQGVHESVGIDQTLHTFLGASKASADIMVQEYGRNLGLATGVFRAGCITGSAHQGTELHGFLAYLVKCIALGRKYTIFGYKGKQVRDNLHAKDLANMFWHYYKNPKTGQVYNVGGSRNSNISILEAIEKIEKILSKKAIYEYSPVNRVGDYKWYITDISKFEKDYPGWGFQYTIDATLQELCQLYM